jgi:hypothetical protein
MSEASTVKHAKPEHGGAAVERASGHDLADAVTAAGDSPSVKWLLSFLLD